jgi:hypothetical protein
VSRVPGFRVCQQAAGPQECSPHTPARCPPRERPPLAAARALGAAAKAASAATSRTHPASQVPKHWQRPVHRVLVHVTACTLAAPCLTLKISRTSSGVSGSSTMPGGAGASGVTWAQAAVQHARSTSAWVRGCVGACARRGLRNTVWCSFERTVGVSSL